jgi:hypothetical protein
MNQKQIEILEQQLHDDELVRQAKLRELKELFTDRLADYKIIAQSIWGKIVISLLEFTPKTGDVVYLVLIAPNKIGEHEAMLWLSPTMEEATRRFHHANHHCDDWQLNNPAGEATSALSLKFV